MPEFIVTYTRHSNTTKGQAIRIAKTLVILSTLNMSPEMIVISFPELVSVSDLVDNLEILWYID